MFAVPCTGAKPLNMPTYQTVPYLETDLVIQANDCFLFTISFLQYPFSHQSVLWIKDLDQTGN